MCTDENSAPHAVRYLNAQLAVLHENAERCLQEHPNARTEENSAPRATPPLSCPALTTPTLSSEHFYALAEFAVQRPASATQIPSENDSLFYASFHAPDLKFICDHDVFLKLSFANGHIAVDSPRSGRR